eukprot:7956952-Heterocapsa_arctica.AAC.1
MSDALIDSRRSFERKARTTRDSGIRDSQAPHSAEDSRTHAASRRLRIMHAITFFIPGAWPAPPARSPGTRQE